jgi:hypothetical protein
VLSSQSTAGRTPTMWEKYAASIFSTGDGSSMLLLHAGIHMPFYRVLQTQMIKIWLLTDVMTSHITYTRTQIHISKGRGIILSYNPSQYFTQAVSHDRTRCSAGRDSALPRVGIHAFLFCVLTLIIRFTCWKYFSSSRRQASCLTKTLFHLEAL